jgi:uncharacterized protein (TIGR00251 family)
MTAAGEEFVVREDERGIVFDVLVQPRSSRPRLGPVHGDRLKLAVTAPPVDGEANAAVVELFARALRCPRSAVQVVAARAAAQDGGASAGTRPRPRR